VLQTRVGGGGALPYTIPPSTISTEACLYHHQALQHNRLGYPSSEIVCRVVHDNKLSCSSLINKESIYDACSQAKSHQLPYPMSSSRSTTPLELIFSDVWVLPLTLLVANNIMLALLMILANLHGSIYFVVDLKYLNSFFGNVGISHLVSCPHTNQQNGDVECKHYHIVEMGVALRSTTSMPIILWKWVLPSVPPPPCL
jgi:hypothetical protein